VSVQDVDGQSLFGSGAGQFRVQPLRDRLQGVLAKGAEIKNFEVDGEFAKIGRRRFVLNARRIGTSPTILIAIEDATARKQVSAEA